MGCSSIVWLFRPVSLKMATCCIPRHCMQAGAAGEEPPAPKKRGRPRKNPDVVVSEADLKGKARRGRPRASKVNPRLMQRSMRAPMHGAIESAAYCGLHAKLPSLLEKDGLQRDVQWLLSVPLMLQQFWVLSASCALPCLPVSLRVTCKNAEHGGCLQAKDETDLAKKRPVGRPRKVRAC